MPSCSKRIRAVEEPILTVTKGNWRVPVRTAVSILSDEGLVVTIGDQRTS